MLPFLKNWLGPRALPRMLVFLFFSAAYLYAFPQANVFYAVVVLLHAFVGLIAAIYLLVRLFRLLREGPLLVRAAWLLITASAVIGVILIKAGTARPEWNLV